MGNETKTAWVVVCEDLFARSEARDAVASTLLFWDKEDAQKAAEQLAEDREWVWDEEGEVWWDTEEAGGTLRLYEQEIG